MKIVHALGWYFPEHVGGTEIYVAGLSRRQREAGYDVTIVAPDAGAMAIRQYEHDGVPVFRYPVPANATRAEAQSLVPARGTEHLSRFVARVQPDVFHAHSIVTGLGCYELEAARAAGARTIVTHHLPGLGYLCRRGTLMERGVRRCDGVVGPARCAACALTARGVPSAAADLVGSAPAPIARMFATVPGKIGTTISLPFSIARDLANQRALDAACDAIVVLNDAARRILIANGTPAEKLVVNRLGHAHIELPRRHRRTTTLPIRAGFMGRLHPTKGIRELVRAVASLPAETALELEVCGIVGSTLERGVLDELQTIAAADRRIRFAGAVNPRDVPGALASYDVLCCPSTAFENGPTVAIEAMAVGTPVIGSRIGNLEELIDDGTNGRLVEPADHKGLVAALLEIAGDPQVVDRWRASLPSSRTMDQIAQAYDELYTSVRRRDAA